MTTIIIKRYPNRKLYNTATKRYITLDSIAALIQEGYDVQIVDHTSGDDLTTLTLTQIIFEQEKKRGGFLPQSVLTNLIKTGGEKLGSLKQVIATPFELLEPVEQEIERRLQTLVNRGELARDEGVRLRNKLLEMGGGGLGRRHPPTAHDLQTLHTQIDELNLKLSRLVANKGESDDDVIA